MNKGKLLELLRSYFTIYMAENRETLTNYCTLRLGLDENTVTQIITDVNQIDDDEILTHLLYFFICIANTPEKLSVFTAEQMDGIYKRLFVCEGDILSDYINMINDTTHYQKSIKINSQLLNMRVYSENTLRKGFLDMSESEIVDVVSNTPGKFYEYVSLRVKAIHDFVKWARAKKLYTGNFDKCQTLRLAQTVSLKNVVRQQIVKSPAALRDYLTFDVMYAPVFLAISSLVLAWIGMETPQMVKIKASDVNFETGKINGWGIPIPAELIPVLKKCYDTKEFMPVDRPTKLYADNDGFLMSKMRAKTAKNSGRPLSVQDVRNSFIHLALNLKRAGLSEVLKISNVALSGCLYRLYQRELQQGSVSRDDYLEAFNLSKRTGTTCLSYKERLYSDYKDVFWS